MICGPSKCYPFKKKTGVSKKGQTLYGPESTICGKITKSERITIGVDDESLSIRTIFYAARGSNVALGDLVNGCEVIADMDNGKWVLG